MKNSTCRISDLTAAEEWTAALGVFFDGNFAHDLYQSASGSVCVAVSRL